MDETITASVLVTTYNVEKTIADTLDCIFCSKTDFEMEVIVVDDASTDSSVEICSGYDVNLIQLETNAGPAHARNVAISKSTGEYLIFVDSDVRFPDDLLQRMMDRMRKEPELAGTGSVSAPEPLNPNFYSRYFSLQEYFLITSCAAIDRTLGICTRCGILKKKVFDEFGGFDERHKKPSIEDYQFSLRIRGTYRIYWDETFVNEHYFPDGLIKILKRLHRNSREMIQVMSELEINDTGPYVNDTRSRILIALSGLLFFAGFLQPWLFLISSVAMAGAIAFKFDLLKLFFKHHGFLFALKGWLLYIVICFPLLTGTVAGLFAVRSAKKGDVGCESR